MKKIVLSILILTFGISLFAQPAGFDRLYYQYKGEEGVVALRIPGFVMKLAASVGDMDHEEKALLRSLRSVTVLTIEEEHLYPGVNFAHEINLSNMKGGYKMLMQIREGDEEVIIAAREKNGKLRDLIVVVGGGDNVLVHVRGRMDSDLLENLAGVAGVDELRFTAQL
jgi:intein/homing endonuclease